MYGVDGIINDMLFAKNHILPFQGQRVLNDTSESKIMFLHANPDLNPAEKLFTRLKI